MSRVCILATGLPGVAPSGGKEKRAWELKEYLEKKGHDVVYKCPKQSLNPFLAVLFRLIFLFSLPPKADCYYVFRCPLFVRRGRMVGDFGRLWIWHWSPIVLLDNFSSLLAWHYCDVRIFNNPLHKWGEGVVFEPGIDLSVFKPLRVEKVYDFIFVGRDEQAKGVGELYELARRFPYKSFHVVGFDGDHSFPNVTYCPWVPNEKMGVLYNMSKGFLLLSHGESFGLAKVEAVACGLPVYTVIRKGGDVGLLKTTYPQDYVRRFDKKKYLRKVYEVLVNG